jgi:hypothetical protein
MFVDNVTGEQMPPLAAPSWEQVTEDEGVGLIGYALTVSDGGSGGTVEVCVGHQAADFPAEWVVDLDTALLAARSFCEQGVMDAQFTWGPA